MSKLALCYTTRLEAVNDRDDIGAILDAKLDATSPARTVDYVGLALDHIATKKEEIANAIKSLQEMKKHEEAREEHIKEQVANWMEAMGIDKLDGLLVSSMSVNVTKPTEELVILDEESLINAGYYKIVLDKATVKKDLQEGMNVEGAKLDVIHVENKVRINKKRK